MRRYIVLSTFYGIVIDFIFEINVGQEFDVGFRLPLILAFTPLEYFLNFGKR